MTDKSMYLMGVRLLNDLRYESSRLSEEEQKAVETTKNALSRFYTQECIDDIDWGNDNSCYCEVFCDKIIGRIESYNKAAEDGIKQYIAEHEQKED